MIRDFSNAQKQKIFGMITNIENEKILDITDWMGDQYYSFQEWSGRLNINNFINNVDEYHRRVIDKNNTSKESIESIFVEVEAVDLSYKGKVSAVKKYLQIWDQYILQMEQIVNPGNGKFSTEYISDNFRVELSAINTVGININEGEIDTSELSKKYNDFMDVIEGMSGGVKMLGSVDKSIENPMQLVASLSDFLTAMGRMVDPENNMTFEERLKNVYNLFKDGNGLLEQGLNIVDAKECAAIFGIYSSSMNLVNAFVDSAGKSVSDECKELSDQIGSAATLGEQIWNLTDSGKDLAKKLESMSAEEVKKMKKDMTNNIQAVAAIFSMATRTVGEVLERGSDGQFTVNDLGMTSLNTGIAGMSSLISGFTFETIEIDVDRSSEIFSEEITAAQNYINATGAPTSVKVAMVVPGTIVATAIGTGRTFLDMGEQLGNKLSQFLWG